MLRGPSSPLFGTIASYLFAAEKKNRSAENIALSAMVRIFRHSPPPKTPLIRLPSVWALAGPKIELFPRTLDCGDELANFFLVISLQLDRLSISITSLGHLATLDIELEGMR